MVLNCEIHKKVFIYVYLQFKSEFKENDLALTSLKLPLNESNHNSGRSDSLFYIVHNVTKFFTVSVSVALHMTLTVLSSKYHRLLFLPLRDASVTPSQFLINFKYKHFGAYGLI